MYYKHGEKGLATGLIIAIVAIIIVGGFGYYAVKKQARDNSKVMADKEKMMDKEDTMMEKKDEGVMMKDKDETLTDKNALMEKYTGAVLAGKSAPLLDFMKSDYDSAIKTDKLIVLYFYANWCPICKKEVPLLYQAFNELTAENVIGFRVNYKDDETDQEEENLAREYGVAYQHTKVFVKNSTRILKAPDSWSKDRYLSEISKALGQ